MMNRNLTLSMVLLFLSTIGFCQNTFNTKSSLSEIILKNYNEYFSGFDKNYSIDYSMYRGFIGSNMTEQYTGKLYIRDTIKQLSILSTDMIQYRDRQILIEHQQKIIIEKKNVLSMSNSPINFMDYSKYFSEVGRKITSKFVIIDLEKNNDGFLLPYNNIKIYINKNTGFIVKQELYFIRKFPFKTASGTSEMDNARLAIEMQQIDDKVKVPQINSIYRILKSGDKVLTNKYKEYKLVNSIKN